MASPLLNRNQARHLTSVLSLLLDDLRGLAVDLPAEPWAEAARAHIQETETRVHRLLRHLDLSLPERAGPRQRLLAYVGAWQARLYDLRTDNLTGYGSVAEGLSAQLEPGLADIKHALERLQRAVAHGGGSGGGS